MQSTLPPRATYPGARHEILNETNHDDVVASILDWVDKVLG